MLWHHVRELCFGNWRNKGVALFFAITIWVVAFQAEMQSDTVNLRIQITPASDKHLVIREETLDERGELSPFDGKVAATVTGPRRQIEKLKSDEALLDVTIPLSPEPGSLQRRLTIDAALLGFDLPGLTVLSLAPSGLQVMFDDIAEREVAVEPVYQGLPAGMEAEPPKLEPSQVKLRGPARFLAPIKVTAVVWMRMTDPESDLEEIVPLTLRFPDTMDKKLVESRVQILGASQVRIRVRVRYQSDSFSTEGVRVRFLIPSEKFPYRVQFAEGTIAVKFQGPVHEVRRLRDRVRSPNFSLGVPVIPLDSEGEQIIPFTEDSLLLYGFSDRVQILQHPERQAQGKGAWTYSLLPSASKVADGAK